MINKRSNLPPRCPLPGSDADKIIKEGMIMETIPSTSIQLRLGNNRAIFDTSKIPKRAVETTVEGLVRSSDLLPYHEYLSRSERKLIKERIQLPPSTLSLIHISEPTRPY